MVAHPPPPVDPLLSRLSVLGVGDKDKVGVGMMTEVGMADMCGITGALWTLSRSVSVYSSIGGVRKRLRAVINKKIE